MQSPGGPGPKLSPGLTTAATAIRVNSSRDQLEPWLARAAAGDERAVARVLEAVSPSVLTLTRAVLGRDRADVDDVAQDALLAIADAIARFRGDCSFVHYARRIAVRTALASRRRRPLLADETLQEQAWSGGPAHDHDQRLIGERSLAALRTLLDELPEGQAESLTMRVVLGCSLDEVAAETGAPVNTVRSRIRLAKKHIRERITGDPGLAALFDVLPEEQG
jgi:RNA polymerase sigma-70 factor (ECF subfamily)